MDTYMTNDCACLYGHEGDMPEFFVERWMTARKEYRCYECKRVITVGLRYWKVVGKWDGEFQSFHFCAECQDIAASLYCDGSTFGSLWNDVEDQIFRETGLTVACIDKLTTPESKAFLQARWMAYVVEKRGVL